jgi:Na+/phosphate symporter
MEVGSERASSEQVRSEILEMCRQTIEMHRLAWEAFRRQDSRPLDAAEEIGHAIHQREKELTERIPRKFTGHTPADHGADLYFLPMHIERVVSDIDTLLRTLRAMLHDAVPFSERAMREINSLFEKSVELLECMRDAIGTRNKVLIRHIREEGGRFERMINEFALFHQERLVEGLCLPKASSLYLAILDSLKGIESHAREIVQKLA